MKLPAGAAAALLAPAALLALAAPAPASAQTLNDDVRCFLLSTAFARASKQEGARTVAAMNGAYYLGRIDGRVPAAQLTASIKSLGTGLPAGKAGAAMQACATRAAEADKRMRALAVQALPRPAK